MMNFPDANDRTPNNPCILLKSKKVLKIYNERHYVRPATKINPNVEIWFEEQAKNHHWSEIKFLGGQCLLMNKF